MKINKLVMGLCFAILAALASGGVAYARDTSSPSYKASVKADQVESQNQRHRMKHSARKEAARRLKVAHDVARENELDRQVRENGHHKGAK